jgi:hypothetical protein
MTENLHWLRRIHSLTRDVNTLQGLILDIQEALGTEESGTELVAVARQAHEDQLRLDDFLLDAKEWNSSHDGI